MLTGAQLAHHSVTGCKSVIFRDVDRVFGTPHVIEAMREVGRLVGLSEKEMESRVGQAAKIGQADELQL